MGCFQLVKNCFMDEGNQAYLLSSELGIWPLILAPIIGNEPFLHGESEYDGILPEIRRQMTPDKLRDPDAQIRMLVYEIILLCAKHKPSRVLLRSQAMYPILRHAHDQEKDQKEHELDEICEQVVPFFILDEDDAQHPDMQNAEKKRARVEQLKQLNEDEDAGSASAASTKSTDEPVDQPVHYLGDELGGSVRGSQATTGVVLPPVKASAALPPAPLEDDFPEMQPIGADESQNTTHTTHAQHAMD